MLHRLPLVFTPQPEGGYTVTEGDTLDNAYANVVDALAAVQELYEEDGRVLTAVQPSAGTEILLSEALVKVG